MVGIKGHKVLENIPPRTVIDKLMAVAKSLEDKILVWGLLFTGMRIGELVHMRRSWVKWELNSIHVPLEQPCRCRHCKKERYRRKEKGVRANVFEPPNPDDWKLVKPANMWRAKTESAVRSIPIAPNLKPILTEFFSKYEDVMDVYPYREMAWYRLKQLARQAHINWRIFPHLLRGCVASQLAGQEVNVYRLKELMGWKKIDMAAEYVKLYRPASEEEVVKW